MTDWSGWATQLLYCNEDTTTPTGMVVCYLQNSIPWLNTLIKRDYYILDDTITGSWPFTNIESGIVSQMWICESFRRIAKRYIGAAGCQITLIRDKDGGMIRSASKTDAAKVAQGMHNDCMEDLDELIDWYKKRFAGKTAQTLLEMKVPLCNYYTIKPPCHCISPSNPFFS